MAALVDGIDVASAGELEGRAGCRGRSGRNQLRRPGKRDAELRRRWPPGALVNASSRARDHPLAQAPAMLGIAARVAVRQPGFRAQGLGHEDGRRPEAVRRRCRADARLLDAIGGRPDFEGFHLFAGSQNLRAESICEAQQKS